MVTEPAAISTAAIVPSAILAEVTEPSAIDAAVIAPGARSAAAIVPLRISALVTAPLAISTLRIVPLRSSAVVTAPLPMSVAAIVPLRISALVTAPLTIELEVIVLVVAAAGSEPHQEAEAALQRDPQGRQVLSLYPDRQGPWRGTAGEASRCPQQEGQLFRSLRFRRRGEPRHQHAAEGSCHGEDWTCACELFRGVEPPN